nr:uncharacterized protein LOC118877448 isoform X5 [Drosophila suzukii]
METSRNILDLPLELLHIIFGNLHVHDQCSLAFTHPYLRQAFTYQAGNRYTNIFPSLHFKPWSHILAICGSTVLHISEEFFILEESLMRTIEQNCTNLQSISIGINESNCNKVRAFLSNLKSLRSVNLWIECVATPKLFRVLRKIKDLKGLEFLRYVGPEEWEMSSFLDLESLSITISSNKTRVDVLVWCLALKNLRRLKLAGFEEWRSIYGPSENIALEELVLNDCDPTSDWPLFHQLKTLKDCYTSLVRSHHQFALKHAKTLEKLVAF